MALGCICIGIPCVSEKLVELWQCSDIFSVSAIQKLVHIHSESATIFFIFSYIFQTTVSQKVLQWHFIYILTVCQITHLGVSGLKRVKMSGFPRLWPSLLWSSRAWRPLSWVKVQNFENPELKKIRIQNLLYASKLSKIPTLMAKYVLWFW